MKALIFLALLSLVVIGCSDGFKIDPANNKIAGTGNTGMTTGYGTTGGTTAGTTGGTTGGTSTGSTTGSACTAGTRGNIPDLSGLVSTFKSQNANLLNADCSTGSRQFITGLVNFLRGQGHIRVGFAGGFNEIDKLAYLWDNGSCEGSTNTTVVDVLGSTCLANSPQFNSFAQNAPFTMTPPSGGSPETGSTTGGTTSGTTTGGIVDSPPDEEATVDAIASANPGLINDCTGIPIVNNFLLTVVRTLQAKDPRWGFMKKSSPFRIPRDVLAYRSRDEGEGTHYFFVIDFVSAGCNNWPGVPEYNDPATNAGVWWHVTNEDGYAGNGTWSFDP